MLKFITSEEGVKAYLIKKIIEVFNTKLDYYIKKLVPKSVEEYLLWINNQLNFVQKRNERIRIQYK